MQLNLKPYYWLLIGIIVTFVLIGVIGNLIFSDGITSPFWQKAAPYVAFGLFLLFAASLVPISLKGFLVAQHKIGNDNVPLIKLLNLHIKVVIIAVWVFFGLGLVTALPFMIKDGFFDQSQTDSTTEDYRMPEEK